jgi:hypothetical protein
LHIKKHFKPRANGGGYIKRNYIVIKPKIVYYGKYKYITLFLIIPLNKGEKIFAIKKIKIKKLIK